MMIFAQQPVFQEFRGEGEGEGGGGEVHVCSLVPRPPPRFYLAATAIKSGRRPGNEARMYVCLHVELTSPSGLQHCLCSLAHLMGASIRKDITSSVTHIVAHSVSGSKYKVEDIVRQSLLYGLYTTKPD